MKKKKRIKKLEAEIELLKTRLDEAETLIGILLEDDGYVTEQIHFNALPSDGSGSN